ncbi:MAG TPA: hypothetical protein EYP19_10680 [Desulfobacterales bacterium]|nr:hypothetical protein [Desulfobacterales bacterium]
MRFSALVDTVRGSLGGTVFSQWKGVNVMKVRPSPRQPRSGKQQEIRGIINTLAGDFYGLTDTQKDLWNKYASLLPGALTGLNAYIRLNAPLYKYLGSSAVISTPPPTPSTPEPVGGLSVTATNATTTTITWTSPTAVTDYVIADVSFLAGRDDRAHPRWAFAVGASASAGTMTHTHSYPTGTVLSYRVRVMDKYGRLSPWSERKDITVPS